MRFSEALRQTTPKALHLPAQGCEARATLGNRDETESTLKGLWPGFSARRLNPVGVVVLRASHPG